MSSAKNKTLGAFAAGLMAATALVTAVSVLPATQAIAQNQLQAAAIDPSKGFADLVDRVMPAVVSVQVKYATVAASEDDQAQGGKQMPNGMEDFFKQFPQFRNMPGMPGQGGQGGDGEDHPNGGMAMGSGFIISADGYAVTNNHVVKDADQVSVTMKDGTEYKAEVIGTDPKTDLALIKIDTKDKKFDYVSFTKDEPRVGDWVMAVGNPFGLGGTVTTGIVSALGRDIGSGPYDNFMQIDAAINRGNSGGPAFNLEGEVVGINTAIFSPSGGSVGIGFAIPASTAENVIESLKQNGKVTRGWLGVQIQPVTEDIAESLGLKDAKGAIVADVTEDSPALAAGVKQGDTILKIDGKDVSDSRDLSRKVAGIKPGDSVPLTIVRDGKSVDIEVKIGTMPDDPKMAAKDNGSKEDTKVVSLADLGLKVSSAQDGAGVTVMDVAPGSAAADLGLKAGDTILEVAGTEVHAPSDVRAALKANDKKKVLMLVKTDDGQRFIALPTAKG